jgi:UMF1 family MFS transporter
LAELRGSRRARLSWALADFAREPFFSFVLSLIFPPFFVGTLASDPVQGTAFWGYSLSVTSLLLVATAPLVGALADATGSRRPWILLALVAAGAALASLWFASAESGHLLWVLVSVCAAQLAIEWTRVLTDSLLPVVTIPDDVGALSGLAVGLGFVASLLYMTLAYVAGSSDEPEMARLLSVGSGAWLIVFMLPCLLLCPQPRARFTSLGLAAAHAFADLRRTWPRLRSQPGLGRFLLARMIYWDGTTSLFSFLAIIAATQLQWGTRAMTTFGIAGLIAGAAAGAVAGRLEARVGVRRSLAIAIVTLLVVTGVLAGVLAMPRAAADGGLARDVDYVYLAAAVVACGALSIVMASSRSLLVRLAEPSRLGEAFGLYVMVGRASSFLAPLLVALAVSATGNQQAGVFGVSALLLIVGLVLLLRIEVPAPAEARS